MVALGERGPLRRRRLDAGPEPLDLDTMLSSVPSFSSSSSVPPAARAHAVWWALRDDVAPNWRGADWSSARLLPEASEAPQAIVAIYAARVGRWRGIFAHHSWIVVKEAGAARYTRYDKVGWGSPSAPTAGRRTGAGSATRRSPIVAIEGARPSA